MQRNVATETRALESVLTDAIANRADLVRGEHVSALRLFNGFLEGHPDLVIDLYGDTVVLENYADPPGRAAHLLATATTTVQSTLPWLRSGLIKTRNSRDDAERRGLIAFGDQLTTKIREHGIWFAIDLTMHQDCSFYLDTRELRLWATKHLTGKTVLNAFSYTGSLGVAALGGGSSRVIQLDRNRKFLEMAAASNGLNGFQVRREDFIRADFFQAAGGMRRRGETFDCVFLDPPFFSSSAAGVVDQQNETARLIDKVRPLVARGGWLVAINNALYVSGAAYMRTLDTLCADGYLEVEELIPVPQDFIGYKSKNPAGWLVDPAPFNHSTKIVVLRVR